MKALNDRERANKLADQEQLCSLTTESEWMNSDEAAAYLRISPYQLRNLTSSGRVPYYKFGRSNRYLRKEWRELLLGQPRGGSYGN